MLFIGLRIRQVIFETKQCVQHKYLENTCWDMRREVRPSLQK
jgi:hypothetical protein